MPTQLDKSQRLTRLRLGYQGYDERHLAVFTGAGLPRRSSGECGTRPEGAWPAGDELEEQPSAMQHLMHKFLLVHKS